MVHHRAGGLGGDTFRKHQRSMNLNLSITNPIIYIRINVSNKRLTCATQDTHFRCKSGENMFTSCRR